MSNIETSLLKISQDSNIARTGTRLESIQRNAQSLAALLERNNAMANAHSAYANLAVSIGADIIPSGHDTKDLNEMTTHVSNALDRLLNNGLEDVVSQEFPLTPHHGNGNNTPQPITTQPSIMEKAVDMTIEDIVDEQPRGRRSYPVQ